MGKNATQIKHYKNIKINEIKKAIRESLYFETDLIYQTADEESLFYLGTLLKNIFKNLNINIKNCVVEEISDGKFETIFSIDDKKYILYTKAWENIDEFAKKIKESLEI